MIAIIKYNAGNIRSVENTVRRLGFNCIVTDNVEKINKASKVIFPGVGEASSAMNFLNEKKLISTIQQLKQPVLGICLGLQLMCKYSEEGNTKCMEIFDNLVKKFPPSDIVPQMGWNNLNHLKGRLFDNIKETDDVYFVHSYYAEIGMDTIGICNYILPFSAALQKNNFYAAQFHPEKSGGIGEIILKNFLSL